MKRIAIIILLPLSALSQTIKSTGQFGIANSKVQGVKKIMLQQSSGFGAETLTGNNLYLTIMVGRASAEFEIPDFIKEQRVYVKHKYFFLQPGIKKYYPISKKSFTSVEIGPSIFYRYQTRITDSADTYKDNTKATSLAIGTSFSFTTMVSAKWTFELGLNKQDDIITKGGIEKVKRSGIALSLHRRI